MTYFIDQSKYIYIIGGETMRKVKTLSIALSLALAVGAIGSYSIFAAPTKTVEAAAAAPKEIKVYNGSGFNSVFRNGPGKDDNGVPVYSFTTVTCDATFDKNGKILDVYFDSLEVSTPNYDGASMPHFSGWPNKQGYNIFGHEEEKIIGITNNTLAAITEEVNSWKTKRDRGDTYHMKEGNDWYKQIDFFQNFFKGKTVAEIETWFAKNCDANGRPIKATTTKEADLAKLAKLSAAEKKVLADVVAGATMSIKDPHGDFLGALREAFENRYEVSIPIQ
jgi:hypothetical protein